MVPPRMRFFIFIFLSIGATQLLRTSVLAGDTVDDEVNELISHSKKTQLSRSKQWLKLVHYQPTFWGGFESEVGGDEFFLSKNGRKDPELELEATLRAFFKAPHESSVQAKNPTNSKGESTTAEENKHPLCRFPARLQWLSEQLSISAEKLPKANCPLYQIYLKRLSPQSASLIFSSYFINSPASTFGHTFLRISRKDSAPGLAEKDRNELLDHGIGYAANLTTDNPVLYAIFGLAGLFQGTYTNVPYYYKVREYNDFESRDLWSYELNLSDAELEMLVSHLWELGGTSFRYYFLSKNCSYQILTALEAAAPRLHLTERLPFYVIPSSTLQILISEPGLVKKISYRPAVRVQFFHRYEHLLPSEKKIFKGAVEQRDFSSAELKALPLENQAHVLDTALDYWDFKYPANVSKENVEQAEFKQKLLIQRAIIPIQSETLKIIPQPSEEPHSGHGSRRFTLENGFEKNGGYFSSMQMRFSLHNFLDPQEGYPVGALIEFFQFKLRYQLDLKVLKVDEVGLIRLASLIPLKEFQKTISWRADLSAKTVLDHGCDHCLAYGMEGGPGVTVQPFEKSNFLTYAFLEGEMRYSPFFFTSKLRLGAGPTFGVLMAPVSSFRFLSEIGYRYVFLSPVPNVFYWNNELSLRLTSAFSGGLQASLYPTLQALGLKFSYYF